jgi:hypothetical protein
VELVPRRRSPPRAWGAGAIWFAFPGWFGSPRHHPIRMRRAAAPPYTCESPSVREWCITPRKTRMSYQVRPGAPTHTRSLRRRAPAVGGLLLLVAGVLPASGQRMAGTSAESMAALVRGEWPAYAGSYASAKYSPLDQIDAANVASLTMPSSGPTAAASTPPSWWARGWPAPPRRPPCPSWATSCAASSSTIRPAGPTAWPRRAGSTRRRTTRTTATAWSASSTTPSRAGTSGRARPTCTGWPSSPRASSTRRWPRACPSRASTAATSPTARSAARSSRGRSTRAGRPASSSCWEPTARWRRRRPRAE